MGRVKYMKVTVIIPVYNAASYLADAVDSALAQPQTGQVLLVEDGSTDNSLSVCRSLAGCHARVELLRHPDGENHGVSASRNLGLAAARCEYIAFLDADDWYLPGRFEAAERIFAIDATVDGVYDAIGCAYDHGEVAAWYRGKQAPELITLSDPVDPDMLFETLMHGEKGFFCTDGIVVHRRLFDRTGGFDTRLRMGEDTAMWIRMSVLGRLTAGSIHEPVGMRRLHATNTIYQGRNGNGKYAVRMAEGLLKWADEIRLPVARRVLLLNWLLNFGMHAIPERGNYLLRKARELRYFGTFVIDHPLALRSAHYWRVLGATLGYRRLVGSSAREPQTA